MIAVNEKDDALLLLREHSIVDLDDRVAADIVVVDDDYYYYCENAEDEKKTVLPIPAVLAVDVAVDDLHGLFPAAAEEEEYVHQTDDYSCCLTIMFDESVFHRRGLLSRVFFCE